MLLRNRNVYTKTFSLLPVDYLSETGYYPDNNDGDNNAILF